MENNINQEILTKILKNPETKRVIVTPRQEEVIYQLKINYNLTLDAIVRYMEEAENIKINRTKVHRILKKMSELESAAKDSIIPIKTTKRAKNEQNKQKKEQSDSHKTPTKNISVQNPGNKPVMSVECSDNKIEYGDDGKITPESMEFLRKKQKEFEAMFDPKKE